MEEYKTAAAVVDSLQNQMKDLDDVERINKLLEFILIRVIAQDIKLQKEN